MTDKQREYEKKRDAKDRLAADLVKHDQNRKMTREQADKIAGEVARSRDRKSGSG